MSPRVPWIRLLTAVAAAGIACVFVSAYDWVSCLTMERNVSLPVGTSVVGQFSAYAYALPVFVFLLGVFFLRRRDGGGVGLECIISVTWLAAMLWILYAVWAWQLPRVIIISSPAEAHQIGMTETTPNKPAAPNAGNASQLTVEHHWPGVGEPGR